MPTTPMRSSIAARSNLSGGTIDETVIAFTNAGTIALSNETFFSLTNPAINIPGELPNFKPVINSGLLSIGAASVYHTGIETAGFENTGHIAIDADGTLDEQTSISLAALGSIANAGLLQFSGTLDLGGGTMDVKPGTALSDVAITKVVQNGTILQDGGALALNGSTLNAITFLGPLAPAANDTITVMNGLTVLTAPGGTPGNLDMTAGGITLAFADSETLDGMSLLMSNPGNNNLSETKFDQTLALGSNAGPTLGAGSASLLGFNSGDSFENLGKFNLTGGVMSEEVQSFTNSGTIAVGGGAALQIGFGQTFLDTGTLLLSGGSIFAGGVSIASGGTVSGFGTLTTAITSDGGISASSGLLQLGGTLTGTGSLAIGAQATLELQTAAQSAQFRRRRWHADARCAGHVHRNHRRFRARRHHRAGGREQRRRPDRRQHTRGVGARRRLARLRRQRRSRQRARVRHQRRRRQHRRHAAIAVLPSRHPDPDHGRRGARRGTYASATHCQHRAAHAP